MSANESTSLRKRILVMRAELERLELADQVEALRTSSSPSALFRAALPSLAASKTVPMLLNVFKRYPFLSSSGSVIFSRLATRFRKPLIRRTLAFGGLGIVIWQAWQLLQKIKSDKAAAPPSS